MSLYYNPPAYAGVQYGAQNWLPQLSLSSETDLHDTASYTLLIQTFVNPSVAPITSAKYTFPLYESCAIVSFRCYIGTRLIEGVIKEKQEATATYQAALDQNEPASLLEQHTADVFTTTLGNIPAGGTVKVEIGYIMDLKHDAEVDGLRFTIPTSIAPRYGELPAALRADDVSVPVSVQGMNISVQISMASNITSVQSPSHPISVHLGGHTPNTTPSTFNPTHALATLGQTSTTLSTDFVLLIKSTSLSSPSAFLEMHPTLPNSKALMLTLVPKFTLPGKCPKPEVVFIVDRSGSMTTRIEPLKSSLSVFLKSLPVDVNFNICSFGSSHSFLWPQSRPYTRQSFAEAQRHCNSMAADLGGTEILPAVKSTIAQRFTHLNLEIMVLTDGQVWHSAELLDYVEKETSKGDVRLFSLGIGRDVSHALIDGLARVGKGFSQVVADEREGMESKVARMLRGALSAHVLDYRVEWDGMPTDQSEATGGSTTQTQTNPSPPSSSQSPSSITRATRRISLFDTQANPDTPPSFSTSPPLPASFTPPNILQAPYKLQPLFPFSRSTAYAILSPYPAPAPTRVWLRGTTPTGDELELEIPVQTLPGTGTTIHQLAARKVLQELKDGIGYLHGGKYGSVTRERHPEVFRECVKKEGERVGLMFGVASEWTSFVAVLRQDLEEGIVVEGEEGEGEGEGSGLEEEEEEEDEFEFVDGDEGDDNGGDSGPGAGGANPGAGGAGGANPGGGNAGAGANPGPGPGPGSGSGVGANLGAGANPSAPSGFTAYTRHTDRHPPAPASEPTIIMGSTTVPVMMMMPPPPPTIPYPTSKWASSKLCSFGGKSAMYKTADRKSSIDYSYSKPPKSSALSSGKASLTAYSDLSSDPISRPSGKASPKAYSDPFSDPTYAEWGSSPCLTPPACLSTDLDTFSYSSNPFSQSVTSESLSSAPQSDSLSAYSSTLFGSGETTPPLKSYLSTPPSQPVTSWEPSSKSLSSASPTLFGSVDTSPLAKAKRRSLFSSSPFSRRFSRESSDGGGDDKNKTTIRAYPRSTNSSIFTQSTDSKWSSKGSKFDSSDISIAYSPPSAAPSERLSSTETAAQPLSLRSKALIDLQTFEGCFMLDQALAASLCVSIADLEAKLSSFVPSDAKLSQGHNRTVWATVLAIKLFETELAGERSVWHLVVDKARAWLRYSGIVGYTDIQEMEKLAEEVLGVRKEFVDFQVRPTKTDRQGIQSEVTCAARIVV